MVFNAVAEEVTAAWHMAGELKQVSLSLMWPQTLGLDVFLGWSLASSETRQTANRFVECGNVERMQSWSDFLFLALKKARISQCFLLWDSPPI